MRAAAQFRAHGRKHFVVEQLDAFQILVVAAAVADGNIDAVVTEVGQGGGAFETQLDLRVPFEETAESRHEPRRGERRQHADRDRIGAVGAAYALDRRGERVECSAHVLGKLSAGLGRPLAVAGQ
jgi:hypothetical protein